jgi:hypothetical protein
VNEQPWQDSWSKRLAVRVIPALGAPLIGLLCRTLRFHDEGRAHFEAAMRGPHPPILGLWHGRILPGVFYFRRRGIVVITSQNFDGEWIARIIERFGFGTARGSSSRNASGALRQLTRHLRSGRAVAFTLDGPRGPAREAKAGALWLASLTGSPIVPYHIEATRAWTLKSWDRAQIPKPFSDVFVVIGEPVHVPRAIDEEALAGHRRRLEDALAGLVRRAESLAGRTGP